MDKIDRLASNDSKHRIFGHMLQDGDVFLHLDPRTNGVGLPELFDDQPMLVLQLGLDMAIPIPDLEITAKGISATLSFHRSPFSCFVPWVAVFAMNSINGMGWCWYDDTPLEVARRPTKEEKETFSMVDGGAQQVYMGGEASKEHNSKFGVVNGEAKMEELTPPKTGHLRLVK